MLLLVFALGASAATGEWIDAGIIGVIVFASVGIGAHREYRARRAAAELGHASMMARRGVLVRRLAAIEDLGSMDVLCTDKTGTLTEGVIEVEGSWDATGAADPGVLALAALNAKLETGIANPLDAAILARCDPDVTGVRKLAEVPFDFMRKRVTIVIATETGARLVTKGAFHRVLDVCARLADGSPLDAARRSALEALHAGFGARGIRVVAVATRDFPSPSNEGASYGRDDEADLTLHGFVTFFDRPKPGVREAIADLAARGVAVKLITGDTAPVAAYVAHLVGLRAEQLLTGAELDALHDDALLHAAERTDIFAEVDPQQKERIILALKKMGHVVGFLGDGVNDAPAMHAADTSLSVDSAVDIAREAADFVLLERDLDVIEAGIEEGRHTFANTLKYVLTTTSANLGNMISMAVASLFLPFLPLTAGQILLNNFLSDVPAFGLAADRVDPEQMERPQRWDMRHIGRFMVAFGLLSSAFDLLTFATLIWVFEASPETFRTGWFVLSLLTEILIALIVRTRRPVHRSRIGKTLLLSSIGLALVALTIPYLPFAEALGFVPLPPTVTLTVIAITGLYVVCAELAKRAFYGARQSRHPPPPTPEMKNPRTD